MTKKDLAQELEKFAQIVIDKNAEQIQGSRVYTVNLLTGIVLETEGRLSKRIDDVVCRVERFEAGIVNLTDKVDRCEAGIVKLTDKVDRCEAGIENLHDKFVHAAEGDRTVMEKIEREKAEQEAINGKVNMRLLRLEIDPKPRKRFA